MSEMDEVELRKAMAVLENYESQIERLNRQANLLRASMDDLLRARDTLNALKNAKEGDELLLPIGASAYINVNVAKKTDVIVGVGTRVSVEKNIDEAIEFVITTGNEVSESLKEVVEALTEIEGLANRLTAAVQNEYRSRRPEQ